MCQCLFLLSIAGALFFIPSLFADKSPILVLALKICWAGLLVVILLAPVQAFREFVIVNDEGLMKSNLFGRQSRLGWKEIILLQFKLNENEVKFLTESKTQLKMSLCYNGWQDFLETSARHLSQALQSQLELMFIESQNPKTRARHEQ